MILTHKPELFYMILDIVMCDPLTSGGFPSFPEVP